MKVLPTTARRVAAVAAAAVAGLAISTAAYAATTSSAKPATIPQCTASDLGVWLAVSQGNGAAGTIYYPLEFTNLSHHTCYMYGYPGVSVISQSGHQLGSPANRGNQSSPHIVNVAPGATAHTIIGYHDAAVSTEPGCHPVFSAAELRVYPPNQRSATYAAFSLESCSHSGPIYLTITEPIIPGVGTVNG
jgi:Protein of unknown function (DUF4232)